MLPQDRTVVPQDSGVVRQRRVLEEPLPWIDDLLRNGRVCPLVNSSWPATELLSR